MAFLLRVNVLFHIVCVGDSFNKPLANINLWVSVTDQPGMLCLALEQVGRTSLGHGVLIRLVSTLPICKKLYIFNKENYTDCHWNLLSLAQHIRVLFL